MTLQDGVTNFAVLTRTANGVQASGIYGPPFGQGKEFLGWANWLTIAAVGGWQGRGILTVQSGLSIRSAFVLATP